uniref:Uncharacterized protein n=1 Tax=Heterorhabditis bacteriophora TaxID=37862 RepID=A0A1I7XQ57_HETBA
MPPLDLYIFNYSVEYFFLNYGYFQGFDVQMDETSAFWAKKLVGFALLCG